MAAILTKPQDSVKAIRPGRVGAIGKVIGTDQSPQMLAIDRERATDLGLTNVEFREMDAEALDLSEGAFDAVLCRWGLMFLPNLPDVEADAPFSVWISLPSSSIQSGSLG